MYRSTSDFKLGIYVINWIIMTRKSSKHYEWHTESQESCFDRQCILWPALLEIEPVTTEPKLYHWATRPPCTQGKRICTWYLYFFQFFHHYSICLSNMCFGHFIYIYVYICIYMFANGPGNRGSIWGRVISKTQKVVLDTSLLNSHHYKVRFKGKVEQSGERSSALPYISVK